MKHFENKSQIWFKVLDSENLSMDNETKQWVLPSCAKKGEWFISTLRIGTLLVLDPSPFIMKFNKVYIAEVGKDEPVIEIPGIIWVRKTRLVREATNQDLKKFGIYRAFQQTI